MMTSSCINGFLFNNILKTMNKRIHTLANPLVSFFMLLLVAVSYTSCKNEDDPTSSTDQHTVSVQFNGYTEASDTTLKKSSKVEVVSRSVQKISNDMNLVATLE